MRSLPNLIQDERGGIALTFGLLLPLVLGSVAAAVEFGVLAHRTSQLQNAADAGALAAARQLSIARSSSDGVLSAAQAMVAASVEPGFELSVTTTVLGNAVEVNVTQMAASLFGKIMGTESYSLAAKAVARVTSARLCMLALEPDKKGAIDVNQSATLTAPKCSVVSNSRSRSGIVAADGSRIDAEAVCSAGGIDGKEKFVRPPTTDCPSIGDPLGDRPTPKVGPCTFKKLVIKGGAQSLSPGVYCDGLKITDGATVTLSPGIYVIQGGKFVVEKAATLEGEDLGLFLTGKSTTLEFSYDSTISLSAPKKGEMAGILIFDDRSDKMDKHRIYSNNARKLLGTIYMPNGALYIDSKKRLADRSDYTVIIARSVELFDGPDLVLNANYEGSSVPVPKGVGPLGSTVSLVK